MFNLKNHLKLEHVKDKMFVPNKNIIYQNIKDDLACHFCTYSAETQIKLDKHILTVHKHDQLHFCKFFSRLQIPSPC